MRSYRATRTANEKQMRKTKTKHEKATETGRTRERKLRTNQETNWKKAVEKKGYENWIQIGTGRLGVCVIGESLTKIPPAVFTPHLTLGWTTRVNSEWYPASDRPIKWPPNEMIFSKMVVGQTKKVVALVEENAYSRVASPGPSSPSMR